MRTYPQQTANRNVPKGVLLVAETSAMSGEIVTTYYIDRDGSMWSVGDWTRDKPQVASMSEMCRLTGDTERMIYGRLASWARHTVSNQS